jgi:polar amino acid transport system substrate-binding protein
MENDMGADQSAMIRELAPTGRLRAAINFGNPVLAQRDAGGAAKGISPALAKEMGRRLGLDVDFVVYERAGAVFDAGRTGAWDICFLARDPARATEIGFSAPYVAIAGVYVIADTSSFASVLDVDRPGVRIGVSQGSAYDLFLTRAIKHAKLIRVVGADAVTPLILDGSVHVAAGVQQPMEAFVASTPGYRIIAEPFMEISQAMGVPAARTLATRYLRRFVEDVKASGFVREVLDRNGQGDVAVGRPEPA